MNISEIEVSNMILEYPIETSDQLEFVVFCIENIAISLSMDAEKIYEALAERSNILNSYIVPGYEILHTQSKEYIINDIIEVMKEKSVLE